LKHVYERIIDVMRKIQQVEIQPPAEEPARATEFDAEVND